MVDLKKILAKKDTEEEYYWSLLIEPGWVQAGIWKIEEKVAKVVLTSPTTPWNLDDDLVASADTALSSVIQGFPEDLNEPSKTVFGVSAAWVKKGEISADYLEIIKKLCSELSLTPIGFVVLPEALAHYKKSVEGTPLNAITLGIYKENLEIGVFSTGNLLGSSQVARSVSLEDDVAEGLARFEGEENLPSRFVLYNGKEGELEDARQSLLKVNWEDFEKLKILHTPKIEITDIKTKIYAVCLAGASELAGAVTLEVKESFIDSKSEKIKTAGLVEEPEEENKTLPSRADNISIEKLTYEKQDEAEVKKESDAFGEEKGQIEEVTEDLGFAVGRDITSDGSVQSVEDDITGEIENYHENIRPVQEKDVQKKPNFSITKNLAGKFGSFKNKLLSLIPSLKIPKGSAFSAGKKIFILGPLFLLLIFALGFAGWWFLPKATVTIYLSPLKLGEDSTVLVNTDGDSDIANGTLSGETTSVSVSGEKTKDTTGTKTVGDRAKGEVTLYRVGSELSLDSETLINGPEGLKFSLDSDVTIASGSASSPGTVKVAVTAEDIGAEYNLAGDTSFSVSNYSVSDIEAKNENSFSGGSSREINAVSARDLEVLEEDLLDELSGQAKDRLLKDLPGEKYFVEGSVSVSASSKDFSADEGEEATSVKLAMKVEAKAVLIDKESLNEYALKYLNEKVPQGYVLRQEQIKYEFEFEDEDDGVYEFKMKIFANLLPQIDKEEIAEKLKGKYTIPAEEYLNKEVPGFVKAEIVIRPNLPDKIKTLPHLLKNIEVEFAAEK